MEQAHTPHLPADDDVVQACYRQAVAAELERRNQAALVPGLKPLIGRISLGDDFIGSETAGEEAFRRLLPEVFWCSLYCAMNL